jgi:hypothetical protein
MTCVTLRDQQINMQKNPEDADIAAKGQLLAYAVTP